MKLIKHLINSIKDYRRGYLLLRKYRAFDDYYLVIKHQDNFVDDLCVVFDDYLKLAITKKDFYESLKRMAMFYYRMSVMLPHGVFIPSYIWNKFYSKCVYSKKGFYFDNELKLF